MHEYSLIQALLEQVEKQADSHGAVSVESIRVRVGEQAGVELDLFRTAFEMARDGTICSQAELELVAEPVRWQCPGCGETIAPGWVLRCAACDLPARLVQGDAILLERMELEVPS